MSLSFQTGPDPPVHGVQGQDHVPGGTLMTRAVFDETGVFGQAEKPAALLRLKH